MQSGSGFILGRWMDTPDLSSLTATASKGVIRNAAGTAWEMRPFALTDQNTTFTGTVTSTGFIASSSATTGNNIQLTNTSTGGHSFQIFTGGQSNLPGMFGIYDVGANSTFFIADPGANYNLRILSGAQFGWSSSATFANNAADTGIARTAAAAIKFTDGSAGLASISAGAITNSGNIVSTLTAAGYMKLIANGNASYLQCAFSNLLMSSNALFTGSSWVYDINGSAASIAVATGSTPTIAFNVAATGVGGNAITWTSQINISTVGLGFFGAAAVAQPNTTGTTTGFTASTGTAVVSGSTFTGNTGSTAYTIGDLVNALKKLGLLAS